MRMGYGGSERDGREELLFFKKEPLACLMPSEVARLAALSVYPVKGLRGGGVERARVEAVGLAGDRRWLVIDPAGRFRSQRELAVMAQVVAVPTPTGLVLSRDGGPSLEVAYPDERGETIPVGVWRSTVPARLADAAAAAWLTDALGVACRLTWMADPTVRPVDPAQGQAADRVSFADAFPLLLASTSSLDDLNRRLAQPIPIGRFRPNLVVSGAAAWAEDGWRRIRIGAATFRVAGPCGRCVVPSIDQESGERPDPKEPLRTLATFRRQGGEVVFGVNLIPDVLGEIALGDGVVVEA